MKRLFNVLISLAVFLTACGPATSAPGPDATGTAGSLATVAASTQTAAALAVTPSPSMTPSPDSDPTMLTPSEGFGPSNFPTGVNPLTGVQVANPALLDRRPMIIKVSNLPRSNRPQWGLSLADIVFEYYTEEGGTRFAAVFYGKDAEIVGPIRSGRFIDANLVRGYKAIFAFGYAYIAEMERFTHSEFAKRLVLEGTGTPLKRYDPSGQNHLVVSTVDLSAYATLKGIGNGRQNLDGMSFNSTPPASGKPATQINVRYSASIYNRWLYDQANGVYQRFSDTIDTFDANAEQYAQLTDRLTGKPVAFNNLVVLYVNHEVYSSDSKGNKIYDILFSGSGDAVAFRDGQAYQVRWQRNDTDVVSLQYPDGTPFPFKPGNTCFEVIGLSSTVQQSNQGWRFTHLMP
jgi:hypothetical protein